MRTLCDGSEMTTEDAEIIIGDSLIYFADREGECVIDGHVNQTQYVAMGVIMGWIDGKTLRVVKK